MSPYNQFNCGKLAYKLNDVPTSLKAFISVSEEGSVKVASPIEGTAAEYRIEVQISLLEYPSVSVTTRLSLIINKCKPAAILTPVSIEDISFITGTSDLHIPFGPFTITPPCESALVSLELLYSSGEILPDSFGLSIDLTGQILILETKESSHAGIYDLVLKAETTDKVSAELNFKL